MEKGRKIPFSFAAVTAVKIAETKALVWKEAWKMETMNRQSQRTQQTQVRVMYTQQITFQDGLVHLVGGQGYQRSPLFTFLVIRPRS